MNTDPSFSDIHHDLVMLWTALEESNQAIASMTTDAIESNEVLLQLQEGMLQRLSENGLEGIAADDPFKAMCEALENRVNAIWPTHSCLVIALKSITDRVEDMMITDGKSLTGTVQELQRRHGDGRPVKILANHEEITGVTYVEPNFKEGIEGYINISSL